MPAPDRTVCQRADDRGGQLDRGVEEMTLAAGTHLGSYEVLAPIGAGGMGEVYQAHDTKLGRDVAIKVLPEAFAHDPERLSRFQREAKMLASLNHPNIATIHGLEQSNGTSYLVMELVSGETLAERIKRDGRGSSRRSTGDLRSRSPRRWKPLTRKASFTAT